MSYCRWSDGDVYAYDSVEGGVQFYVSRKKSEHLDRLCRYYAEAYQYAKLLRDVHGLDVPDYAIEALRADAIEEAMTITGPNGVVAELVNENAKLRELAAEAWRYINHPADASWTHMRRKEARDSLSDSMRELGVEGIGSGE